ncbi:hypothetical protein EDB89DRAFT_170747 [Lactarius sanguifluus]|nr:hypothetical protein EDB89DRAFT_170747 [Lactarius sanguifluus]
MLTSLLAFVSFSGFPNCFVLRMYVRNEKCIESVIERRSTHSTACTCGLLDARSLRHRFRSGIGICWQGTVSCHCVLLSAMWRLIEVLAGGRARSPSWLGWRDDTAS